MDVSLYVFINIRPNDADIYPICNHSRLYVDGTVCPRLKLFIQAFERGFVFIC